MICPRCRKNYFFIKESGGKICFCQKCNFCETFSAPSYSGYHDDKYSYTRLRTPKNDPLFKQIFKLLNFQAKDKVLDYGCGAGDLTHNISQIAPDTIGVDLNIDKAVARFPCDKFQKQTGERLAHYKNGHFDKIILVNVIEHIHHFESLLGELNRILAASGKIFITTYDAKFILHSILNDPTHVIEWDKQAFEALIYRQFKINNSFRSGSFFNYAPFNGIIVKFLTPELCIVATKRK